GSEQRINLLTIWGNALVDLGDIPGSMEKYREQIRLNPQTWIAYSNLINSQMSGGDEEGALQTAAEMDRAIRRSGSSAQSINSTYFQNQEYLKMDMPDLHAATVADMDANRGVGTSLVQDAPADAEYLARMHETGASEQELETSP